VGPVNVFFAFAPLRTYQSALKNLSAASIAQPTTTVHAVPMLTV